MKTNTMTSMQFFIESLEHKSAPSECTEEYSEGYADVIDSVLYAIRSGDIKNLLKLSSVLLQMSTFSGDYEGEFGAGYQAAIDYCLKQFEVSA